MNAFTIVPLWTSSCLSGAAAIGVGKMAIVTLYLLLYSRFLMNNNLMIFFFLNDVYVLISLQFVQKD